MAGLLSAMNKVNYCVVDVVLDQALFFSLKADNIELEKSTHTIMVSCPM